MSEPILVNESETETLKPLKCEGCGHVGIADVSIHAMFHQDRVVFRCRGCKATTHRPSDEIATYAQHMQDIATQAFKGK